MCITVLQQYLASTIIGPTRSLFASTHENSIAQIISTHSYVHHPSYFSST